MLCATTQRGHRKTGIISAASKQTQQGKPGDYEDVSAGGVNNANDGTVTVIYGSAAGLAATDSQVWTPDSVGEAGDWFGLVNR